MMTGATGVPNTRYTVTLNYDATEDRLVLRCDDAAGHAGLLQLTRRIMASLLPGLMRLLAQSGATLQRVPAGLQQEALHFEHQSALAQAATNHTALAVSDAPPEAVFLVTAVDISLLPDGAYEVRWVGAQAQSITLTMSRYGLHCLTHLLQQRAQAVGWDLPAVPSWMQPGDDPSALRAALS